MKERDLESKKRLVDQILGNINPTEKEKVMMGGYLLPLGDHLLDKYVVLSMSSSEKCRYLLSKFSMREEGMRKINNNSIAESSGKKTEEEAQKEDEKIREIYFSKREEPNVYVVIMYRWGFKDDDRYILGVYNDNFVAYIEGWTEYEWRGHKYEPDIVKAVFKGSDKP